MLDVLYSSTQEMKNLSISQTVDSIYSHPRHSLQNISKQPYRITIKKKNSLRIKVTGKCQLKCNFCHKEGDAKADDIEWNRSTRDAVKSLIDSLKITKIHITGGEPTCLSNLEHVVEGLTSMGLSVKATTNGQFTEKRLIQLVNHGLSKYNFSFVSVNPNDFVKTQTRKSLNWAKNCIERQKRVIKEAINLKIKVKLNTIVNSDKSIPRVLGVYNFAKKNGIQIRLLNNLYNGELATDAIKKIVMDKLKAEKLEEKVYSGCSSKVNYYKDLEGFKFGVKQIIENKLNSLCLNCKSKCIEQFYGIRLQRHNGIFFVKLCLVRTDEKSFLPLSKFLKSEQLAEMSKI